MSYTPYYPGGWIDLPNTTTPIIAAALNNMETGIGNAVNRLPQNVNLTTATSSFNAGEEIVTLLSVVFSAAGRLRLYNSSAARTADSTRAVGVLPTTSGILYEYNADTNNEDDTGATMNVGVASTVYWQLDGGPTVALTYW